MDEKRPINCYLTTNKTGIYEAIPPQNKLELMEKPFMKTRMILSHRMRVRNTNRELIRGIS